MRYNCRSDKKEILDLDDIPREDLYQNLHELDRINDLLGGYRISIHGLKSILRKKRSVETILDVGFGGGDSIRKLSDFTGKTGREVFYYGVDLKKDCVEYAEMNLASMQNKKLIQQDYRNLSDDFLSKIDVMHCSLFLHHLTNEEITELFRFARTHHCIVIANDLHRNMMAYHSIKILTKLFSSSYLVKNDAPVSVLRGFRKSELVDVLRKAGYTKFSVKWKWAFRYLIIAEE